ncbi:hypothetical protein BGZ76_003684 [Entomortierella beljakovae]|nr:hypothetical protein BGZ76_003684 [Entomortierella beljakovae]
MFPRSERFVEKIEITPGPNHYDIKSGEEDPYKRFGFLGKTKRFNDLSKENGAGLNGSPGELGLYERNSHSTSLPSLIIDDDSTSIETASVHSNGSVTPDRSRRPSGARSKSSDKLGLAFVANNNKVEERLKKELADLTEKFEKYRIARQKDLDLMSEKQKKTELSYQTAIKDKNSIQTQLASRESEIADLGVRHSTLKATLEKSEKSASLLSDKIGKNSQLQKRIDELERLLTRAKLSLEEQESHTTEAKRKLELERQQLQLQLTEQKVIAEQEKLQAAEWQRQSEQRLEDEMKIIKDSSDVWKSKFEALEKLVKELELKLEDERKTVEELRASMKKEREQMQGEINKANEKIQNLEQEKSRMQLASKETEENFQREKQDLHQQLQIANTALEELSAKQKMTEELLKKERERHSEAVETMTAQYKEQQAYFTKERNENSKARQDLEKSIAHLINELGQNREALLKVQSARAQLQDKYDQSQSDLKNTTEALETLGDQHRQLQETFKQEQESWTEKYESLLNTSVDQKKQSDGTICELRAIIETKDKEHSRVMQSIEAIRSELMSVERQRGEAIALRSEEEKKVAENQERISKLEEENTSVRNQFEILTNNHTATISERDQLKNEVHAKEQSIKSLESEIELIMSETKEREAQDQIKISELEAKSSSAAKEIELLQGNQKVWELERVNLSEEAVNNIKQIESLQSLLEKTNVERDAESRANTEKIKGMEARCHAMEMMFKEMFEKSGSTNEIDGSQANEVWRHHSSAVMEVLAYHTSECSLSKTEHTALLEEKATIQAKSESLSAALKTQEEEFKTAIEDHSGLLAKIAELEELIRHLRAQVEFLEADNIGKEAIIKALEDEYEYQQRIIRELSKNEDAVKEVERLESELRVMTNRIRETDDWVKEVQDDNKKYREAYVKADISREETLLDMAKLHEELAESEQARLQVENQLNVEVNMLIKKNSLTNDELSRLSKMNVDSAQNMSLKQKVKQVAQLKDEILGLKKKNLGLSNTRDSLRLRCLQNERDLEAYKAANATGATIISLTAGTRQSRAGSISGSSIVSCSSISAAGGMNASSECLVSPTTPDQLVSGKLQLQGLIHSNTSVRSRSTSISSTGTSKSSQLGSGNTNKVPIKSRAARSFMAGHSTTS